MGQSGVGGEKFCAKSAAWMDARIFGLFLIIMSAFAVSDSIMAFVAERMRLANCAAHDMQHCLRVANLARRIALTEEGANPAIAYYGGLLHDVLDHKLYGNDGIEATQKELTALLASEPLVDDAATSKILEIVRNVGYKNMIRPRSEFDPWALSVEYRCVQDADLLDAIGAVGVARCMAFSGKGNRTLFGGNLIDGKAEVSREVYMQSQKSAEATAIGHFFEKLLRIRALIMTDKGKKLGEQRHANMVSYLSQLDGELQDAEDASGGAITEALTSFL